MSNNHADWLTDSVNPKRMKKCARKIARQLNKDKEELGINAIAVSGFSGSIIGGIVSYLTDLPLILIRKDGESKHSSRDVEFNDTLTDLNYCIIDDFTRSKNTVERMIKMIEDNNDLYVNRVVKFYFYRDTDKSIAIDGIEFPVFSFHSGTWK